MTLKKNDCIELIITGMTAQGSGVGRYAGIAVFVANTAVGDRLKVKIIKTSKNYVIGKIEEILTPSPARIPADCEAFKSCGGCVYRHIGYESELAIKEQRVKDALARIGGFTQIRVDPIIGAPNTEGYRNKAQFPAGRGKDGRLLFGFYAFKSHRIVECNGCRLQPPAFAQTLAVIREWAVQYNLSVYNEQSHTGKLRHVYLRYGEKTGELMVCLVINGEKLEGEQALAQSLQEKIEGFQSLIININRERTNVILGKTCRTVYGPGFITDILCGLRFKLSPLSFYQINAQQAERLYEKAGEYAALEPGETLLDLYCGTGTIGLTMAGRAGMVIGVEAVKQAVLDAEENAAYNGIKNARFICADAVQAAQMLKQEGIIPDVIVLDPPRKGCDRVLVDIVAGMRPKKVVYVSCDPATLARDLKAFSQSGYIPQTVTPVDMFPRTAHVETVVLLSKGEIDSKKVRVEFSLEGMDMSGFQKDATYGQIKERVLQQTGLKVSSLYIAQVKQKHGIIERENYNKPKSENSRQPKCPPEKEAAITEALKFFGMI